MVLLIVILLLILLIVILGFVIDRIVRYADTNLRYLDRYREYFILLNQWLLLKQNNISISHYLIEKGYTKIAVYGMGFIGFRLCDELKDTEVKIMRTIDRAANTIYHPLGVWEPNAGFRDLDVDVVIITVNTLDCSTIHSYMDNKEIPVLKIEDIIYNL